MKCIAYVSQTPISERGINLPIGMSGIVKVSRKFNPTAQITGIISYRQEQYFQVLEGPDQEVDNLMLKIAADNRHENVWIFLDSPISERCFPSWEVNIFDFVAQSPFLKEFIRSNQSRLSHFTDQQKQILRLFIDIDESATENANSYEGKSLRLLAWPDLNSVRQPQDIINLCIKLTKKPYPFDKLVNEGEFGTRQQLIETIKKFETSGILTITELESQPELIKEQVIKTKKSKSFYGAIKRFLGMG